VEKAARHRPVFDGLEKSRYRSLRGKEGCLSKLRERGILIAVEGIDGAGKTTQVGLLRGALDRAGEPYVASKEPTDGKWGRIIKASATAGRLSPEEELDAFIKDRAEHADLLVSPALDEGKIVILDRYFYSSIAYQGSRGANVAYVKEVMESRFRIPDAVFILDIDPVLSVHRIAHSRGETPNHFENTANLAKAREIFQSLNDPAIHHIDGAMSAKAIHERIIDLFIEGALKAKRTSEWARIAQAMRSLEPAHSQS
jgi:dTMP kinase